MGLFHVATSKPTKIDLVTNWLPTQPWAPVGDSRVEVLGSCHFDDPEGDVGMQLFILSVADTVLHVPLTYRAAALGDAEDALLGTIEHSVLGVRYIYDGLRDDTFIRSLVGATLTGQGNALGMLHHEGRWLVSPATLRLHGGGWGYERAPVDRLATVEPTADRVEFRSDRFELDVFRRPTSQAQPPIGLSVTWQGQTTPVLITELRSTP